MAADVTLLKTRAECLVAKASLTKERAAFAKSDYLQNYSEDAATERASARAADLAKAQADVVRYTADVARTDLSKTEKHSFQRSLITARGRVELLQLESPGTDGPTAYLAGVDAEQVDGQLAILDAALVKVQERHDALPA